MKHTLLELMKKMQNTVNSIDNINQDIKFIPLNDETIVVSDFVSYIDDLDSHKLMPNGDVHFFIKKVITRFTVGTDEEKVDVYVKWDDGKWVFGISVHPGMKRLPEWPMKLFPNSHNKETNGVEIKVPFVQSIVARTL